MGRNREGTVGAGRVTGRRVGGPRGRPCPRLEEPFRGSGPGSHQLQSTHLRLSLIPVIFTLSSFMRPFAPFGEVLATAARKSTATSLEADPMLRVGPDRVGGDSRGAPSPMPKFPFPFHPIRESLYSAGGAGRRVRFGAAGELCGDDGLSDLPELRHGRPEEILGFLTRHQQSETP